jgi:hypothetical protein
MERVYNQFKGMEIVHKNYKGILCGYNDEHFILAVEGNPNLSFRKLPRTSVIELEQYKDVKYRYIYENESELIKQDNDRSHNREA